MRRCSFYIIFFIYFYLPGKTFGLSSGNNMNCADALEKCEQNHHCKTALRELDEKCKVSYGRCSAEMMDLPACGQMMDDIFAHGFPETRCTCRNLQGCHTILEKIYDNPCFVSIRHLRKQNLFPYEIDNQLRKTASTTKKPSKQSTLITEIQNSNSESKFKNDKNRDISRGDQSQNSTGEKDDEERREYESEKAHKDNTNYKMLTIILGVLLGVFILGAIVFFAWSSVKRSLTYTQGKEVSKTNNRHDTTSSSLAERGVSSPPKRPKA